MTKRTAKGWVVKKWVWMALKGWRYKSDRTRNKALVRDIPGLKKFYASGHCAYCREYRYQDRLCKRCPIVLAGHIRCEGGDGVWIRWSRSHSKKDAQAMLDLVRKT